MGVTRESRGQENVAPRELSILWPSKGTGQMGMSRKECGKSHSVRIQGSCRVFGRKKKRGLLHPCDRNWGGKCRTKVRDKDRKDNPLVHQKGDELTCYLGYLL